MPNRGTVDRAPVISMPVVPSSSTDFPPERDSELLVIGEQTVAVEAAQLLQRFVLDLANALAADLQLLSHLSQRVLMAVAEAEAELEHQLFTRCQRIERRVHVALEHRFAGGRVRRLRDLVGDQVAKAGLILAADRRFERDR